jgi:hypothetical protein
MNKHALFSLLLIIRAASLNAAETNHAAQLKQLTEKRDNAVKEVIKPIDGKYHELLGNLQKSAATANDFETVTAIQKILNSSKAAPTMEDYFPAGSKWTGVWTGGAEAETRVRYEIIRSTPETTVMEFVNERGKWEIGLSLLNGLIKMDYCRAIEVKNPARLYDIAISGRMESKDGKKKLELTGQWKWKHAESRTGDESLGVRFVMEES